MVLSIPLPSSFDIKELLAFGSSLFIYLLSFLVVGAFWNQHHKTFIFLDKVNQKLVVLNIIFLFFLSLIPLFTKWVIQNQGSLIPVIGYDIVFLITIYFSMYIFRLVMQSSSHKSVQKITEKIQRRRISNPYYSWIPFIVLLCIVGLVVVVSIYLPKLATFILMGIPIASSIINLFISRYERHFES